MRTVLSIAAVSLLIAACQGKTQWTKGEAVSQEAYSEDLAQCGSEASLHAAQDLAAMPPGPDKASAQTVQRALRFNACMEDKGYSRIR